MPFGKYAAETRDGVLTLELVNEDDCIFQFEGGEAVKGSYYIKNNRIYIWGGTIYPIATNSHIRWEFLHNNNYGIIKNGSFRVRATRIFYDEWVVFDITFNSVAGI